MTDTGVMLDEALAYLRQSLPVFPICSPVPEKPGWCNQHGNHDVANTSRSERGYGPLADPGKHPLVQWGEFQNRLPTEDEVSTWWKRWPTANIGMATGKLAGYVVLDSDGLDAYTAVLSRGGVEPTPTVITGKQNGFHWYLKWPNRKVTNFAGDRGVAGLDFRGDGGFVVLPPSLHRSGTNYRWHASLDDTPTGIVPLWLLNLLGDGTRTETSEERPAVDISRVLEGVAEGKRDDTLYRAACRMRADDVPRQYAELLIREAARNCTPSFPSDVAVAKVAEVYRRFTPTPKLGIPSGGDTPEGLIENEPFKWEVFNGADYLARDLPPILWLVDKYLREHAIGFLFGAPGALKTFVGTDLALAIASGSMFLDIPCLQGKVLIIQEDTPDQDYLQTYLRPMAEARLIDDATLREWLYVAPPSELKLDLPERLAPVEAWIAEQRPAFVLLDAFYLLHSGNGISEEDLRPVITACRRLRTLYGCSFLMIDHDRKSPGSGKNIDENGLDRLYGGRIKGSGMDVMIEALPVKGDKGSTYLHVHKLRGAKPPEAVRVHYEDGTLAIAGTEKESKESATRVVHEWLSRQGGTRTIADIANGTDMSPRNTIRAIADLLKQGSIQKLGKRGHADLYTVASPFEEGEEEL